MENGVDCTQIKEEPVSTRAVQDSSPSNYHHSPLKSSDNSSNGLKNISRLETWSFRNRNPKTFRAQTSHFLSPTPSFETDDSIDSDYKIDPSDDDSCVSDENDDYQCKVCRHQFVNKFQLFAHLKSRRSGDKRFKCCSCEKVFRDNTQLNVHARKHTGEQPYVCKICGKKFSVNGNLNKHMRIHTGERRFECDTCERKFTQFAHLEDHMKTHSGERPFVCDFCNTGFKTNARLKKHQKSHAEDRITKRSVACPVCCKIMKSAKQLVAHMETHDEGPQNPFQCEFCDKSYKTMFALNYHIRGHGNVRDFKCDLCDRTFTNSSHLRRHMTSHTGIRPFNCELCNRGFPTAQNLKRHMMTHTGEKPFSCDLCARGFLTMENLTRHKRTHTGEKPFPCKICGKFFAHSTTAKEHLRIHTGDKPFGCSLCEKRFSLNKILYRHIREKHPDHFEEFKRINDIPPNQKRAREKIKRESMKFENCNNSEFSQMNALTVPKVEKTEAEDGDDEDDDNNRNNLRLCYKDGFKGGVLPKVEKVEDCHRNKDLENQLMFEKFDDNGDIPFIKVEKVEYEDS